MLLWTFPVSCCIIHHRGLLFIKHSCFSWYKMKTSIQKVLQTQTNFYHDPLVFCGLSDDVLVANHSTLLWSTSYSIIQIWNETQSRICWSFCLLLERFVFFLCGFSADVFLILQFLFRMGHTIGCFHLSLRDCKIWSFCCSCELLSVKSRSSERRKLVCEISALGSFELVSKLFFFFFFL